jgi:hypothetical protein
LLGGPPFVAVGNEREVMSSAGFFESIARDLSGPGMFGGKFQIRLVLQPLIAVILGLRLGVRDAKVGRPPFFQALGHGAGGRGALLREAVRDALMPLIVAVLVDSILQQIINHRIRPIAAVIVGGILVFLPFLIVRALANRAFTHAQRRQSHAAGKTR